MAACWTVKNRSKFCCVFHSLVRIPEKRPIIACISVLLSFCHSLRGCWTESCPTCQRWVALVTRCLNISQALSWVSTTKAELSVYIPFIHVWVGHWSASRVCVRPPIRRQAERGGDPVSHSERQTYEPHQWRTETVSQLQPLQRLHASLRRQHGPRGWARQGLVASLISSDSHQISWAGMWDVLCFMCSQEGKKIWQDFRDT